MYTCIKYVHTTLIHKQAYIYICVHVHNTVQVGLLVRMGYAINSSDVKGRTPIHSTAQYGHLQTTSLLLDNQAGMCCACTRMQRTILRVDMCNHLGLLLCSKNLNDAIDIAYMRMHRPVDSKA